MRGYSLLVSDGIGSEGLKKWNGRSMSSTLFLYNGLENGTLSSDYQTNINSKMDIHIGKLIKEELRRQGRSVKWFEEQIHRSHSACYDIFRSHDINTELLKTISKVLNHDFFIDLSEQMYGKTAQNCMESPSENA